MAKGGCLFFLRAGWRVSSRSLSRGKGSVPTWLPFVHLPQSSLPIISQEEFSLSFLLSSSRLPSSVPFTLVWLF
jgi:hypothetical protein